MLTLWLDADACPRPAREVAMRAALRLDIPTKVVANVPFGVPAEGQVESIVVSGLADAADNYIADNVVPGDLVVTADVPLAARVVAAGALALSPRGKVFDADSTPSRLATRNLLTDLRERGVVTGGPSAYSKKDKRLFASALDSLLTRLIRDGNHSAS